MLILRHLLMVVLPLFLLLANVAHAELVDETEEEVKPPAKPTTSSLEGADDQKAKQQPMKEQKQGAPRTSPEQRPAARQKHKTGKVGIVKFRSNTFSAFRDKGTLVLEEDVVVTQDDIRIEADKATIYFEQGGKDVREVHAIGSVRFSRFDPDTGDPIRAEGREAVFSNAKRTVVLKGEPILHRGDDVVRGKAIYYDLRNGWVKADRVEGVVQPVNKKAGSK